MQIVILAAGKGTRMGELTLTVPKPLLPYHGKTLLEHKLDSLPPAVTEIILVIGYLGQQIRDKIGEVYAGMPVRYVEQTEQLGTAHALWSCRDILKEKFLVAMSDDIYEQEDIERLASVSGDEWAILCQEVKSLGNYGKCIVDENDNLKEFMRDPDGLIPYNLMYTGACLLSTDIFSRDMAHVTATEFGLPQTLAQFAPERPVRVIRTGHWKQITKPEDLA